jgi:hypothetical protein
MSNEPCSRKVPLLKRVQRAWNGRFGSIAPNPNGLLPLSYFQDSLIKERARADRSSTTFSLVVFTAEGKGSEGAVGRLFDALAESLAYRTRICDSKGWYNNGIGLILPNTPPELVPDIVFPVLERVRERTLSEEDQTTEIPRLRYDFYAYPSKNQARMRQQPVAHKESHVRSQAEECER